MTENGSGNGEAMQLALGDFDDLPLEEQPEVIELDELTAGLGSLALPPTSDTRSVAAARLELADRILEGATCPCCDRPVRAYRWSMYATAVRTLAGLYRAGGTTEFVHVNDVKGKGQGDGTRLRGWGLAEEEPDRRPDGGKSGWWRVTELGEGYLHGEAAIPRYLYAYNRRVLRAGGEPQTIEAALGKAFDFDLMMKGEF